MWDENLTNPILNIPANVDLRQVNKIPKPICYNGFTITPCKFNQLKNSLNYYFQENGSLQNTIDELTKELEALRIDQENTVSSLQGFNAKEESYRNEVKMMKKEMESLANIKNQEIQSLRFEISNAELQHQTAANVILFVYFL